MASEKVHVRDVCSRKPDLLEQTAQAEANGAAHQLLGKMSKQPVRLVNLLRLGARQAFFVRDCHTAGRNIHW